jgi:2-iminobutanoate/2-iminopropanoate deaminase
MSTIPTPLGPYQPVVRAGDWLVCSGQLGTASGRLVDGGTGPQTTQALANLKSVLETQGAVLTSVVKATVFLADIADFEVMNTAYLEAFGEHRPARSAFAVAALPRGAAVEIEAWAWVGN